MRRSQANASVTSVSRRALVVVSAMGLVAVLLSIRPAGPEDHDIPAPRATAIARDLQARGHTEASTDPAEIIERIVDRIQARPLGSIERSLAAGATSTAVRDAIGQAEGFIRDEGADRQALERALEGLERPYRRVGAAGDEALALMARARGYRLACWCRVERTRHLERALADDLATASGATPDLAAVERRAITFTYTREGAIFFAQYLTAAEAAMTRAAGDPGGWADLLVDLLWDLTVVAAGVTYADVQPTPGTPGQAMTVRLARFASWMDGLGGRAGPPLGRVAKGLWALGWAGPGPDSEAVRRLPADLDALEKVVPDGARALAPLASRVHQSLALDR